MPPAALEAPEHRGVARKVHAVITFPGSDGWASARAAQARLVGDVSRLFDARKFGAVSARSVSAPYLVRVLHGCAALVLCVHAASPALPPAPPTTPCCIPAAPTPRRPTRTAASTAPPRQTSC